MPLTGIVTKSRALLLASGPTGTNVAGAWAVSLTTSDPAGLSGKQIGTRLAAAISGQASGKTTTIVGAGRDHVQMKLLSLPPAPADELPEMVRFQAEREFTALGTDAALDFIPLSGDAQTPHQVLAIALSPAGMAEVRELCEPLGVEPDRVAIRACAAGRSFNGQVWSTPARWHWSSIRSPMKPTSRSRRASKCF